MKFLFAPVLVDEVLEDLPTLRSLLSVPRSGEGASSVAFPETLRKTDTEIYRFLANTHYPHLQQALREIELVHAAGCRFGTFLKTRDRQQFASHLAEVLVAEELLRRGFEVTTVEQSRSRTPDLLVKGDGIDIALEVYTPREWLEIESFDDAVKDLLKNKDAAVDFDASVTTRARHSVPPDSSPWEIDRMLKQTRAHVLSAINADLERAIASVASISTMYPHPDAPLETQFELESVRVCTTAGPIRNVAFSSPGPTGYSPEGTFKTVLRRAVHKAKRGQTQDSPASTRGLLVSLMRADIAGDLVHPVHHAEARKALEGLDPGRFGLDLISFVARAEPRGIASVFAVFEDTKLSVDEVNHLFGAR